MLTTTWLFGQEIPILKALPLVHIEPGPVTSTVLLLAASQWPTIVEELTEALSTRAPSLIVRALKGALLPSVKLELVSQVVPAPVTVTELEFAPVLYPIRV